MYAGRPLPYSWIEEGDLTAIERAVMITRLLSQGGRYTTREVMQMLFLTKAGARRLMRMVDRGTRRAFEDAKAVELIEGYWQLVDR